MSFKSVSSYVTSHPFKITSILVLVIVPTLFFFQNCARLTYEDPGNPDGVLGSPTGGNNPIGGFAVSGVTGDVDSVVDNLLVDGRIPTFHWTEALNAVAYDLVVKSGSTIVCQAQNIRALTHRVADCVLNYQTYDLVVTAIGDTGRLDAPVYPFKVEEDIVDVVIGTPQVTLRNAVVPYTVKYPENAASLTCRLVDKKTNTQLYINNCLNVRQMSYSNLPYSDYIFIIDIRDKNGRQFSRQREFSVLAPNCDPLSKDPKDDICEKRLKANVYFHTSKSGSPFWGTSAKYISDGILSGTVYLSQVNIPTRKFNQGFPGVSARYEYFGLDITTKIKASDKMPAGNYQLALLSDDGSSLYSIDQDGNSTLIINHEGDHSTQFKCATKPFALASKINLRLTYYQGPASAIALVMMYRPWAETVVNSSCPTTAGDGYYGTFPAPLNVTSWPGSAYQKLLDAGWKVVPAESFENPDL